MADMQGVRKTDSIDSETDLWPKEPLVNPGTWWWLTGAIAIAIILGMGFLDLFQLLGRPLAVIFVGISIAATLEPIVLWLQQRLPRTAAILLVYLAIAIVFVALGWMIVPALWEQATRIVTEMPGLIDRAQEILEGFGRLQEGALGQALTALMESTGSAAVGVPSAVTSVLAGLVVAVFISLYWLIQAPDIEAFFMSLFPLPRVRRMRAVLDEAANAMGGYLRGVALNALVVGLIVYVGLLLIGVDYPLVLALLAGVLELIPVVGPIVAGAIIVTVTFFQSTPKALISLVFIVIMQQVENNLLVPNILSAETNISPLTIIIAIFVGGAVGGVLGVLVAIPLAAFLQVLVARTLAPALRRRTGAPPVAQDEADEDPGRD